MNRLATLGRERLAAGVLVIGAVVFTATGVVRLLRAGGVEVLTLPLALLAADLVIAGALVTRWYAIRPVAQGLAIFGALVHVLVLLRSGPWLIRGWSALLAVAHVGALVLFFALSAHEQYDDEDDDGEDDEDTDLGAAEVHERVGVGAGYGPFAALPAPRLHTDLLPPGAGRAARPRAEVVERPAEPLAEQLLAEQSVAEPDLSTEQPAAAEAATDRTERVAEPEAGQPDTAQPDTAQPDTEQPETEVPDQPAEPARAEAAEDVDLGAGTEQVDSGAGRRGAPEGKE